MSDEYDETYEDDYDEESGVKQDLPPVTQGIITKYRVEADIPKDQKKQMESYRTSYGRHVVYSNTKRMDNPRHLNMIETQMGWNRITLFRERATLNGIIDMSEFQMCRSNEPVGGFESQIQATRILHEKAEATLKEYGLNSEKKNKFFDRFRKKKKSEGE